MTPSGAFVTSPGRVPSAAGRVACEPRPDGGDACVAVDQACGEPAHGGQLLARSRQCGLERGGEQRHRLREHLQPRGERQWTGSGALTQTRKAADVWSSASCCPAAMRRCWSGGMPSRWNACSFMCSIVPPAPVDVNRDRLAHGSPHEQVHFAAAAFCSRSCSGVLLRRRRVPAALCGALSSSNFTATLKVLGAKP